jgi:hypothetical protein
VLYEPFSLLRTFLLAATLGFMAQAVTAQSYTYVHPQPSPEGSAFRQPPHIVGKRWVGPEIVSMHVDCWHAEPDAPTTPVGGVHGAQDVVGWVQIDKVRELAAEQQSYQQSDFGTFSGGGAHLDFAESGVPHGIFVSVRGHPIWQLKSVAFAEANGLMSKLTGRKGRGLVIKAKFTSEPSMGECYLYSAVWTLANDHE